VTPSASHLADCNIFAPLAVRTLCSKCVLIGDSCRSGEHGLEKLFKIDDQSISCLRTHAESRWVVRECNVCNVTMYV